MPLLPPLSAVRRGLLGLTFIVLAAGPALLAQTNTQSANDGFNPNVAGVVDALAVQTDGKLVIAGSFTSLQPNGLSSPVARANIARVAVDGSVDAAFDPEANGPVLAVALQPNGQVLIGGSFTTLQPAGAAAPITISYIARLNADGSVDKSFNPAPGGAFGGNITAIAVQPNGQILIGGYFTTLQPNGAAAATSVSYLARLNGDGTVDTSFKPTPNAPVAAILVQPDGQILIGGTFTSLQANGAAAAAFANIARLHSDGSLDKTFNPTANNQVKTIGLQANGQILIGGAFTSLQPNGASAAYTADFLARLNTDGSIDGTFTPQLSGVVDTLLVQSNGQIVIGGQFTNISYASGNIFSANYLARLNPDGTGDSNFLPNPNYTVYAMAFQADGKLVIGGGFSQLKPATATTATVRTGIARVNPDGTLDADFNPSANGGVGAVAPQTDGRIVFGGTFTSVAGLTRNNIARLNTDGSVDAGFDPEANGPVMAIAIQGDGKVVIGGTFSTLRPNNSGTATGRNFLARLNADGSIDTGFNPDPNGQVNAIAIQADGRILVAGLFTAMTPNGTTTVTTVDYVARLNTDGTLDTSFEPNPSGQVKSIILQPSDNAVIIGGLFTSLTPAVNTFYSAINYVARLNIKDGTLDTSFNPNPAGGPVNAMLLQADGKIVLGGSFTTLQPNPTSTVTNPYYGTTTQPTNSTIVTRNGMARVNSDGTLDMAFDPEANAPILSLSLNASTGQIVAGGAFTAIAGGTRHYLARLNPDGTLDAALNVSPNGQVNAVAYLAGGQFCAGGAFTTITPAGSSAIAANHIARFNADGSFDLSFQPYAAVASQVRAIAAQTDGKVVFGGLFSSLGGTTGVNLVRFNIDGTPDTRFNVATDGAVNSVLLPPSGAPASTQEVGVAWLTSAGSLYPQFLHDPAAQLNGQVNAVAVMADGRLVVGGNFTNGTSSTGGDILRFGPGGTLDTSFHLNPNGKITAIVVQSDGRIVVAGAFTQIVGETYNYIARFNTDGSVDTTYNPDMGAQVNALVLQPDGKIIAGGAFTTVSPNGGAAIGRYYMARLNTDGTVDGSFNPNGNGQVNSIVLQADGKVLVGGQFTSFQPNGVGTNVPRGYIARLNSDGTLDSAYDPEANNPVMALAVQSDGRIVAGGSFTSFQPNAAAAATSRTYLARLNTDGTLDGNFNPVANNPVLALAVQSDGRILAGGSFTTLQPNGASAATSRNYLARLNSDGTVDSTFDPNLNGTVDAIAVQSNGNLVIGGSFTTVQPTTAVVIGGSFSTVSGVAAANLATLNADGSVTGSGVPSPNSTVYGLAAQSDGRIILAGAFTSLSGTSRNGLARLKTDATLDPAFNPNVNGTVYGVAVQADGRIVLAGSFTSVGGAARGNVARVNADGSVDAGFAPLVNGTVYTVAVLPNGQITLAGSFSSVGGAARSNLARLNSDGTVDAGFTPNPNGTVYALALQTDGETVLGGAFTSVNGTASGYIARVNSDGSLDSTFTSAANGAVDALALQPDGKLFVAGSFSLLDGQSRLGYGRLAATTEAVQTLSVSGDLSTVVWTRGGSGPEVSQASFQYSADGYTWTGLGQAVRVGTTSAWQITGLSLPSQTGFYLRTLGMSPTSEYGSGGLVQQTQQFYVVSTSGLSSASTSSGTAGAPYYYAVAAINSPTSYAASGLPAGLSINAATGVISGTPTQAGTFIVTLSVTNAGGTVTFPLQITIAAGSAGGAVVPLARLTNLSSRDGVTAANPLIDGFVITGSASKTVLLRAVGPGLGTYHVTGTLAVPVLRLFDVSGRLILTNRGWDGSSTLSRIFALTGAFPFVQGSADCAVVTALAPGAYTLQISSGDGTGGNAMAEIYDADSNPLALTQRLSNLSGRGVVDAADTLIGGFIIFGSAPKTVLVRAAGPALAAYGISGSLAAPLLGVYDSAGNLLAQNTGWGNPVTVNQGQPAASASAISAAASQAGAFAFPSGSADSAVIVTLPPGAYTGQITGSGGTTGAALFEIYEVP